MSILCSVCWQNYQQIRNEGIVGLVQSAERGNPKELQPRLEHAAMLEVLSNSLW